MDSFLKILFVCALVHICCIQAVKRSTPLLQNSTEEMRAIQLQKNILDCTEKSKVNPNIILKLKSGKWNIRMSSKALRLWALCLLMKSGMMSSQGVLKQDVVLAPVPQEDKAKVEKVIDKCLYKKRHSPPDTAWHYLRCFHYKSPKYSLM